MYSGIFLLCHTHHNVPELLKRGYDQGLTLGSICAAGTLGLMIPPSLTMVIYGAATGESIGQLFMAGVFPGLVLAGLFFLTCIGLNLLALHGRDTRSILDSAPATSAPAKPAAPAVPLPTGPSVPKPQ